MKGPLLKMKPTMVMIVLNSFASCRKTHKPNYEENISMRMTMLTPYGRKYLQPPLATTLSFFVYISIPID